MLTTATTALLIIDVQGKLANIMDGRDALFDNLRRLIRGAQVLDVPIICTEQIPRKLGPTVPEVSEVLGSVPRLPKSSFGCLGCPEFVAALTQLQRPCLLVAGIEAHVCVYQTVMGLLERGYQVQVVGDAVSSRTAANRQLALTRMAAAGAVLTGTEMALMELLVTADDPRFRDILQLIR